MLRDDLTPEVRVLASEAFSRSWQFLERDPVFAGQDRQQLQEQLAQVIIEVMRGGDRNLWAIANRAIGALRERCAAERVHEVV